MAMAVGTSVTVEALSVGEQAIKSRHNEGVAARNSSHNLRSRLLGELNTIPGYPNRKGFFPEQTFTNLIHKETVREQLKKCQPRFEFDSIEHITDTVCGAASFRKVFVLLVLFNKLSDIQLFINEGVSDQALPLSRASRLGTDNVFRFGYDHNSEAPTRLLTCFADWDAIDIWTFEDWQWTTLAPILKRGKRRNVHHITLQDDRPLPFTSDSRYGPASEVINGGFSTVFKIRIHPSNHHFDGPENAYNNIFAVKCLSPLTDRERFKQEVDMLTAFSGNTHPHLISLLATYEQFQRFCLVFPWAESDLQRYMREIHPNPPKEHSSVQWMAKQCFGIADGLRQLHRHQTVMINKLGLETDTHSQPTNGKGSSRKIQLFGRHGDIKLQNVLWFRDPSKKDDAGVLKITDFGLAEFKTSREQIYKGASNLAFSRPYQPPECDMHGGIVGQSHDIWSLGCLYLELIAWSLGGWELVKSFQEARAATHPSYYAEVIHGTFFTIVGDGPGRPDIAVVKPAVTMFIKTLHRREDCPQYLHEFLELIETEMLIIKTSDPLEKGRITIPELTSRLSELCRRCQDKAYATIGTTWVQAGAW